MKKIAILCNYMLTPDRIGGMDRFFIAYDIALKEKGFQIDWFFSKNESTGFFKDLSIYSDPSCNVEDCFVQHLKKTASKYDHIITHFTELCTPYYKQYKQLCPKANIIVVDHNPRPLNGFSFKKKLKKKLAGVLYGKYINQFVGVSQYTVNHILNDYGSFLKRKTKVIYNGIDTTVFKMRTQENKNKFIVASHLRASKGIQDLLKALSILPKQNLKDITVDIYGKGPYEEQLKQLSKKYNLTEIVTFKGSSASLHKLFANYSYMIQPTYMECFSLSILESLSANIPVITTTVGGNLEVLCDEENSFIYPPGDYEKLANIIKNISTGKKSITTDVSKIVHQQFYLKKMVDEHVNMLLCAH